MHGEDQYIDRTPDLVAKIRSLREAAESRMNRFTCVADYDVRRVVGQKPKDAPVSDETVAPSPPEKRRKNSSERSPQTSIEFSPAPADPGDDGEGQ